MNVNFLLVDDSAVVRLLLRRGLEREGIGTDRIQDASNPRDALRLFRASHPEVVFMDLTFVERPSRSPGEARRETKGSASALAVMGGEVAARKMMEEDPSVRIVVCTGAHDADPRVRELVRLGAFYVMLKPVQVEHLRAFLKLLQMDLEPTPRKRPGRARAGRSGAQRSSHR